MKLKAIIILLIISVFFLPFQALALSEIQKDIQINAKIDSMTKNQEFETESILVSKKGKGSSNKLGSGYELKKLESTTGISDESKKKEILKEELKKSLKESDTLNAQPNYLYKPSSTWSNPSPTTRVPTEFNNTRQWNLVKEKVPEMWKDQGCETTYGCGGTNDVTIAVIDTGLGIENFNDTAGFTGKNFVATGSEFTNVPIWQNLAEVPGDGLDNDCNGVIDDRNGVDTHALQEYYIENNNYFNTTCSNNQPLALNQRFRKGGHPVDTHYHGSLVTSMITNSMDNTGSVGPAFNVRIMPIAASRHTTSSYYSYFSSYSLYLAIQYARQYNADVISMSLGNDTPQDSAFQSALNGALAQNIVVVAASGNESTDSTLTPVSYPAAFNGVIAVGGADNTDSRVSYANGGPNLSVVGYVGESSTLGDGVYFNGPTCLPCNNTSTFSGYGYYISAGGTSSATPQVAALAGLIKAKNKFLSPAQVKTYIEQNATDLLTPGFDNDTGHGAIDFQKTLNAVPANTKSPMFRFWSPTLTAHFFTIDEAEKDLVVYDPRLSSYWNYESVKYYAYNYPAAGTVPVYRFWSPKLTAHFYTASESEKDLLLNDARLKSYWDYEGIKYYAYDTNVAGSAPVYRFWSPIFTAHFYTTNETEKNNLINDPYLKQYWTYEGIKFYAYNNP